MSTKEESVMDEEASKESSEHQLSSLRTTLRNLQSRYDELNFKYQAEVSSLQHVIEGDFEKWQSNGNKKFFTKKWQSLKRIKLINGNLIISLEDEKEIMHLEKDVQLLVIFERLDNFMDYEYTEDKDSHQKVLELK